MKDKTETNTKETKQRNTNMKRNTKEKLREEQTKKKNRGEKNIESHRPEQTNINKRCTERKQKTRKN
jgi:hypothetical protein